MAEDQKRTKALDAHVFGWTHEIGKSGFAHDHFPLRQTPLSGGIVAGQEDLPVFKPGYNFHKRVNSLEHTIAAGVVSGGQRFMPATEIDGYRFAMILDPEGNSIGMLKPFTDPFAKPRSDTSAFRG